MKKPPHRITLKLNDIQDLFVSPSRNPYEPKYMPMPVIDELMLKLKLAHLKHGLHVTFLMPASAGHPAELEHQIKAGLKRYCDVALAHLHIELEAKNRSVIMSLEIGLGILAASLGLAAAVSNFGFLAEWLRNLLSNAISIFGSVALWSPVDAFLFGIRPLYKNVRICKAISHMHFEVQLDKPSE